MQLSISPSSSVKLTSVALLIASLGFAIQIAFGVAVPTIPPGLVIMLVPAALIAFLRQPWTPGIGVVAGLFLLVGFFASGAIIHLIAPTQLGILVGSWIQFIGLLITVIAGSIAIVQNYRHRTSFEQKR